MYLREGGLCFSQELPLHQWEGLGLSCGSLNSLSSEIHSILGLSFLQPLSIENLPGGTGTGKNSAVSWHVGCTRTSEWQHTSLGDQPPKYPRKDPRLSTASASLLK